MAKHIAKLVVTGMQIVGKAFTQAVRQEIRISQEAAKRNAQRTGGQSKFKKFSKTLDYVIDIYHFGNLYLILPFLRWNSFCGRIITNGNDIRRSKGHFEHL